MCAGIHISRGCTYHCDTGLNFSQGEAGLKDSKIPRWEFTELGVFYETYYAVIQTVKPWNRVAWLVN